MAAKFKIIIFDLDGTLVNAYKAVYESINHTMEKCGLPRVSAHVVKRSVGWGDKHLIEGFVGPHKAPAALKIYRRHHKTALKLKNGVTFLPGAKGILSDLESRGYRLAIATNRPKRFTKIILKILGIDKTFGYVLCGDEVKRAKPYPDMLWQILKKFKLTRAEALYVGDMTIDVKTGRAARVKTVAVLTGSSTRAEIGALKPYRIIRRISQLGSIIQ